MMLLSVSNPGHASDVKKNDLQVQAEMDSSLKGITGIFMQLARLGLVQYLPNTLYANQNPFLRNSRLIQNL